jgi:ribosomal protein L37AE/L43A
MKIVCCDRCGKKQYVERTNGRWLCVNCQDVITETAAATKASGAIESA